MSNEGRICPQCGYERQARDLAPDYECPRCGIIYAKHVPTKPPAPAAQGGSGRARPPAAAGREKPAEGRPAAPGPAAAPSGEELVPASLARRAWAGFHTGGKVSYYAALMTLPLYYGLAFICFVAGVRFSREIETLLGILSLLILGLIFNAYLFYPARHGETWGQRAFGLTVYPLDPPRGELRWTHWLLRGLGSGIAGTFAAVTAPVFFYALHARKNIPSLADRLSGTRQYEKAKPGALPFRASAAKALNPCAISLLILFFLIALPTLLAQQYLSRLETRRATAVVSPEELKKRAAFRNDVKEKMAQRQEAGALQNTFRVLSDFERRHHADLGGYTEDLEALVARYGTARSNSTVALLVLIRDGSVRARSTAQGIEIAVRDDSGSWQSREIRP